MRATKGNENVFVDCGFPPAEAENLRIRAKLMMALSRHLPWTADIPRDPDPGGRHPEASGSRHRLGDDRRRVARQRVFGSYRRSSSTGEPGVTLMGIASEWPTIRSLSVQIE